jgi:imidazolonepropionase-like amidohydrolase
MVSTIKGIRSIISLGAALAATACLAASARADILIEHVNVISMLPDQDVQADMNVLIRNGRIESITSAAASPPGSSGAKRIDARGQWLMPGLADMHVHLESDRIFRLYMKDPSIPNGTVQLADALLPYVANGVLQIAVLSSTPETIAQRDDVEYGRVLGPHIALAAMIDGPDPVWPVGMTRVAATPSDGRQAVRDVAAEGYEFVKAYERLDVETFVAICGEAKKLNMKVIGHLPESSKGVTQKVFVPGFSMIAHAEEIAQQDNPPAAGQIARYAEWAKDNGTWLTSTVALDERIVEMMSHPETLKSRSELQYLAPAVRKLAIENNHYVNGANPGWLAHVQRVVDFNRMLIPAFAAAGVPIVAGTDALVPGIVPGFSLHDELEALASAGLSNRQVLESATRLPAEWLGTSDDRGVIATGKRADLLLLERNPLERIENTRRIAAVIVGGELHSRKELDERMEDLRHRNTRPSAVDIQSTSTN